MGVKIDIGQLKADREAGSDGPWVADEIGTIVRIPTKGPMIICCAYVGNPANASRIARLPDLEAAYIEALGLLKEMSDRLHEIGYVGDHDPIATCEVADRVRKFLEKM